RRSANSDESIRLPRATPGLWPWESGARMDTVAKFVSVYLRLALGTAFLSAVADRFGLWGPPGARSVGWGDFAHFMSYTAEVNPWAPPAVIAVLAWLATAVETVLGIALVLGLLPRLAGLLSGIVLLLFALGMCVGAGVKSALAYSVFSASAAGFALFASRSHPWSDIGGTSGKVRVLAGDISSPATGAALVESAERHFGGRDKFDSGTRWPSFTTQGGGR